MVCTIYTIIPLKSGDDIVDVYRDKKKGMNACAVAETGGGPPP